MKICPDCAEEVRVGARKCRYCGYRFEPEVAARSEPRLEAAPPSASLATAAAEGSGALVANFERMVGAEAPSPDSLAQTYMPTATRYAELARAALGEVTEGETPQVLLAGAQRTGLMRPKARGVMLATDQSLLFCDEKDSSTIPLEAVRTVSVTPPVHRPGGATAEIALRDREPLKLVEVFPAASAVQWATELATFEEPLPQGVLLGAYGRARVYASRSTGSELVGPLGDGRVGRYVVSNDVAAEVGTAGNLLATRSRHVGKALAGGGAGLIIAGPLGLLGAAWGRSKDHVTDAREVYLVAEGPDWAWSLEAEAPEDHLRLERFAQAVRLAGRLAGA